MAAPVTEARISNAEPRAPGLSGGPTTYSIAVLDKAGRTWTVQKRYSEFRELEKELTEHLAYSDPHQLEAGERHRLPAKGLTGFRHRFNLGDFNLKRQKGLDMYLDQLVDLVAKSDDRNLISIIASFLSPADCIATEVAGDASNVQRTLTTDTNVTIATCIEPPASPRKEEERNPAQEEPQLTNFAMDNSRAVSSRGPQVPTTENLTANESKDCSGPRNSSTENSTAIQKKRSIPSPRKSVAPPPNLEELPVDSQDWQRLSSAFPEFSQAMLRCEEISKMLSAHSLEAEETYKALRRNILTIARGHGDIGLDEVPGKTLVWFFLLKVGTERRIWKGQCKELVQILEKSAAWMRAFEDHAEFVELRADLQS